MVPWWSYENCDPKIMDFEGNYSLLSYAYVNQKYKAL